MSTLHALFAYKAWANRELFARLQTLDRPEQAATLQNAVRTLDHIHVVDGIFRAHLLGQPHGLGGTRGAELPGLDALQLDVADTDAWYLGYVQGLQPAQLGEWLDFTFTDGDAGRMTREEILLHITAHGAYHRGNVGQMLKEIGVAPPRDLFTKFLHQSEPQRRT